MYKFRPTKPAFVSQVKPPFQKKLPAMRLARPILISFLLIFNVLNLFSQNQPLYFPPTVGTTWQTTSPASLGFCPERVDSLYAFLAANHSKSFILLKDGKIVLEKYFDAFTPDSIWYWASAGKSLTAFLVGQAQEEGLFDIEDPTSDYLGAGWTACTPAQEAAIKIRHQLEMTTGLDDTPTTSDPDPSNCADAACLQYLAAPGTRWAYHNAAYRLLHDVIATSSGLTINQFTKNRVLDRTGMKGFWFDHIMYGRARDMARFGLLTLAQGVWNGDTLLHDAAYLYDMAHPSQDLNKSYGYLWWLNGQPSFMVPAVQIVFPGKLFPNAPNDLIAALGKNDQKIHVVPSKGWVVVRQGNAAGNVGPGGNQVPIVFDNQLWAYLNQLDCNAVGTTDVLDNQLTIAPNPATEGWRVSASQPIVKVELFDAQGRLLRSATNAGDAECWVGAADLPQGAYALRVWSASGLACRKVLKH
jgi:CubicO group peptidase (beta-lactamase class C family)